MTYGELSTKKTTGFQTNCIIDDVVNNARFCSKNWRNLEVTDYDRCFILKWCAREGVRSPFTGALVIRERAPLATEGGSL